MMQTRLPHSRAMGSTSGRGRDEEVVPACVGHTYLYDYLIDERANSNAYQQATVAARDICNTCPLRDACLAEHKQEVWAQAILRSIKSRGGRPVTSPCGTFAAYRRHLNARETPCDACRDACAEYATKRRAKQKEKAA